ncbi:MAG: SDR family NAD(P)-dependent oxidoreductase [Bryobacteraceae bacterium]|jgi:short-subunit dehydrogenase
MRIEGKVVLITGASGGIGAACAAEFARAGARLALAARSADGLARNDPGGALLLPGDLTQDDARHQAVDRAIERFGHIDILINNAGVGAYGPSFAAPLEETRRMMELNFFAPLALTQLVAPQMRARRSGTIVNVGSIGGKVTLPWMTLYCASKYAVAGWTDGLRMELARDGVGTLLVCPGYVVTGFQRHALAGGPPAAVVRARRFAISAAECARAVRRGVERDARTVVTPRSGWLLVLAARLAPALVHGRMARMRGAS